VTNLEFVLSTLQEHCSNFARRNNIKNVLLFFYSRKINKAPKKAPEGFTLVKVDYSKELVGNYVNIG
jgi:hypothetical protein